LAAHLDNGSKPYNGLLHHLKKKGHDYNKCVFEISCFGPDLVKRKVHPRIEHEIIQEAEAQLAYLLKNAKPKYTVVGKHEHKPRYAREAKQIVDELVATLKISYLKAL
jgi:hypothetical protein